MSLRLSATERVRKSESIESGLTQFGLGFHELSRP